MSQTILIPVDGSANSNTAVQYGLYIAPKIDAMLAALHVIDLFMLQGPVMTDLSATIGIPPYDGYYETLEKSLQEKADTILKDFEARCKEAGMNATSAKTIGKISDTIIEGAKQADMILMARKGEHFHLPGGELLGSVAEAVVRRAGKPVWIMPENFREIESMGLGYDGSEPAKKALNLSLDISRRAKWPLTVIIVTPDPEKATALTAEVEDMNDIDETSGQADCEVVILPGREPEDLLSFIEQGSVELMVMGAYGHNRLREWLLGSTTSCIIKKSPIPVLLIR